MAKVSASRVVFANDNAKEERERVTELSPRGTVAFILSDAGSLLRRGTRAREFAGIIAADDKWRTRNAVAFPRGAARRARASVSRK